MVYIQIWASPLFNADAITCFWYFNKKNFPVIAPLAFKNVKISSIQFSTLYVWVLFVILFENYLTIKNYQIHGFVMVISFTFSGHIINGCWRKLISINVVKDLESNLFCQKIEIQKQPYRGFPRKRCSENIQQIYRRTSMPKCDFNKVAATLLKSHFRMSVLL